MLETAKGGRRTFLFQTNQKTHKYRRSGTKDISTYDAIGCAIIAGHKVKGMAEVGEHGSTDKVRDEKELDQGRFSMTWLPRPCIPQHLDQGTLKPIYKILRATSQNSSTVAERERVMSRSKRPSPCIIHQVSLARASSLLKPYSLSNHRCPISSIIFFAIWSNMA
jgi:hypothetical protein